jgi:hypothetical protein
VPPIVITVQMPVRMLTISNDRNLYQDRHGLRRGVQRDRKSIGQILLRCKGLEKHCHKLCVACVRSAEACEAFLS